MKALWTVRPGLEQHTLKTNVWNCALTRFGDGLSQVVEVRSKTRGLSERGTPNTHVGAVAREIKVVHQLDERVPLPQF